MNKKVLTDAGIDYENGVERFLGDSDLYESILLMFIDDETFSLAVSAYEVHDYEALFRHTHTLKGVAGNVDMTALYRSASALTNYLRGSETPLAEMVDSLFNDMRAAYMSTVQGIKKAKEG